MILEERMTEMEWLEKLYNYRSMFYDTKKGTALLLSPETDN
jgi:hypothetical protein